MADQAISGLTGFESIEAPVTGCFAHWRRTTAAYKVPDKPDQEMTAGHFCFLRIAVPFLWVCLLRYHLSHPLVRRSLLQINPSFTSVLLSLPSPPLPPFHAGRVSSRPKIIANKKWQNVENYSSKVKDSQLE